MICKKILSPILDDEGLTRGLADPEARILIEWLVWQAEDFAQQRSCKEQVLGMVEQLCRRARAISRFVCLWSDPRSRGAALQLAATERFAWPLPTMDREPCDLMLDILEYEVPVVEW